MIEGEFGVKASFHPHVGTAVEFEPQIDRLLAETDIDLCFDTGHHAFWDQDPLAYMDKVCDRIAYMHLKNVDPAVRARVLRRQLSASTTPTARASWPRSPTAPSTSTPSCACSTPKDFAGPVVVEQDIDRDTRPRRPLQLATPQLRLHAALA